MASWRWTHVFSGGPAPRPGLHVLLQRPAQRPPMETVSCWAGLEHSCAAGGTARVKARFST